MSEGKANVWDQGYYDRPGDRKANPQRETAKAYSAFRLYLDLGPRKRSLQAVADHLRVSHANIRRWAGRFHWVDRVDAHFAAQSKAVDEAATATVIRRTTDWVDRWAGLDEAEWKLGEKLTRLAERCADEIEKIPTLIEVTPLGEGAVALVTTTINPALMAAIGRIVKDGAELRRRAVQSALVRDGVIGTSSAGGKEPGGVPGGGGEGEDSGALAPIPDLTIERTDRVDAGAVPRSDEPIEVPHVGGGTPEREELHDGRGPSGDRDRES